MSRGVFAGLFSLLWGVRGWPSRDGGVPLAQDVSHSAFNDSEIDRPQSVMHPVAFAIQPNGWATLRDQQLGKDSVAFVDASRRSVYTMLFSFGVVGRLDDIALAVPRL